MNNMDPNASWAIDRLVAKMFNWRDDTGLNDLFPGAVP